MRAERQPEGELQEFLNRYAAFVGIELSNGELFIELAGSWEDVIMDKDTQVIFDEFFAREMPWPVWRHKPK